MARCRDPARALFTPDECAHPAVRGPSRGARAGRPREAGIRSKSAPVRALTRCSLGYRDAFRRPTSARPLAGHPGTAAGGCLGIAGVRKVSGGRRGAAARTVGSYGRAVRVLTGTSGWSYPAWKGSFYPRDLPATRFLEHYASRLATVEVNATFYRMPLARTLALWRAQAPAGFVFALKAPQRITHQKRLLGVGEDVGRFFGAAVALGSALGPVLFQLPPL